MDETEDPVAALENLPIDCHSAEVQNYKIALNNKIPSIEKLLIMYKFKEKAFHDKVELNMLAEANHWLKPQIELAEKLLFETKIVLQHCDESTFNSSNILDYLENLHAFREEQKEINRIDVGTNPLGPMTALEIELIHLTNNVLRTLKIVDMPDEEPVVPH